MFNVGSVMKLIVDSTTYIKLRVAHDSMLNVIQNINTVWVTDVRGTA